MATPQRIAKPRVLMCAPRFFGVEYVINPWMEGNVGRVRRRVAAAQWKDLHLRIAALAHVEVIEPSSNLPDMAFTANGGLVLDDLFVASRFRFRQRQPEVAYFTEWFRAQGYRVAGLSGGGSFEGEGDALLHPGQRLLWGGYGVRTSLEVYRQLAELLDMEVVPLRLVDERFYHLDTCFCPLPEGRLLYYPAAFDTQSLAIIAARVPEDRRIAVSSVDALQFACNAVIVGSTFIANGASDELRQRLAGWGYKVETCPLTEFLLAGGGAKCLVLQLDHPQAQRSIRAPTDGAGVAERIIEIQGHLLDRGVLNRTFDCITAGGGSFEVIAFQPGLRHDQPSVARMRVVAPLPERLDDILSRLLQLGAQIIDPETDARCVAVVKDGVAPADFYSTTIYPTDVRVEGRWVRAAAQRMDAVLVVRHGRGRCSVRCRLLRDLRQGDQVVCGLSGVRVHAVANVTAREPFTFMSASASSERRVTVAVERIAWDMQRLRERGGRIVVVGGPVVIHTGGGLHLASLIRKGYVQALLGGNGLATHDIEAALFGTSLGVDLQHGGATPGGHQNHLRAINLIRTCGGIAAAVEQGQLRSGIMYECALQGVPFALAGSIRDDGPLPETMMDLLQAQAAYAQLIQGADLILMLASMLHSIGVGNMTPAGVRLICVDISAAVVTKLADRGSLGSQGIVTDVGLFLNLLDAALPELAANAAEDRGPPGRDLARPVTHAVGRRRPEHKARRMA